MVKNKDFKMAFCKLCVGGGFTGRLCLIDAYLLFDRCNMILKYAYNTVRACKISGKI